MTLNKALNMVEAEYKKALGIKYVYNPVAYALYRVWRMADTDESKQEISLRGKCGGCEYAKPAEWGRSKCHIECTNRPDRPNRSKVAHLKPRTSKACKRYKPKGENEWM